MLTTTLMLSHERGGAGDTRIFSQHVKSISRQDVNLVDFLITDISHRDVTSDLRYRSALTVLKAH